VGGEEKVEEIEKEWKYDLFYGVPIPVKQLEAFPSLAYGKSNAGE